MILHSGGCYNGLLLTVWRVGMGIRRLGEGCEGAHSTEIGLPRLSRASRGAGELLPCYTFIRSPSLSLQRMKRTC